MKRALLLSVKPRFVAKILNGEKTIEVRKSNPKCYLPIEVYIYCTKDKDKLFYRNTVKEYAIANSNWKLINFVKVYNVADYPTRNLNGKVVAKFALKKLYLAKYQEQVDGKSKLANKLTCLTDEELDKYLNKKNGYGWVIDDLVIFDKPKEISEFRHVCELKNCKAKDKGCWYCGRHTRLTKAPQSWCYIETENEL